MEIEDEDAGGVPPQARACSIKLDTRKLSQALHYLNIKYDSTMCCTCASFTCIGLVSLARVSAQRWRLTVPSTHTHSTGMVEDSYFILMVNLPGHCGALTYYLPVYLQ